MPPRTAIQARRSLGANPVPSRSGGSYGGGEDFGSPYKDEDNKYTPPGSSDEGNVDYGGGGSGGDQGSGGKGGGTGGGSTGASNSPDNTGGGGGGLHHTNANSGY